MPAEPQLRTSLEPVGIVDTTLVYCSCVVVADDSASHGFRPSLIDLPADLFTSERFHVVGVFKIAQTCRALHDATAPERRVLGGRMVVYKQPLSKAAQHYIMRYMLKERPSRIETMVYVHMLLHLGQ